MRTYVVMVLVVYGVASLAAPPQPTDGTPAWSSTITPEVRLTVERALGRSLEWSWQAETDRFGRRTVCLRGEGATAHVDAETGVLVECFLSDHALPPTGPRQPVVDAERAYRIAHEFIARVGLPLARFEPWRQKYSDHGDGGATWFVSWSRWHAGVRMPCQAFVVLNACTGEVISYSLVDAEVSGRLALTVDGQSAVRQVAARAGLNGWRVERLEPSIWFEPSYPGPLVLRWEVELADVSSDPSGESRVAAIVNAETGGVTSLVYTRAAGGERRMSASGNAKAGRTPSVSANTIRRVRWPCTAFAEFKSGRRSGAKGSKG